MQKNNKQHRYRPPLGTDAAVKDGLLHPKDAAAAARKTAQENGKTPAEKESDAYNKKLADINNNKGLDEAGKKAAIARLTKKYVKHGAGADVEENPLYGIFDDDPEYLKNYLNSGGKITTAADGTVTMEGGTGNKGQQVQSFTDKPWYVALSKFQNQFEATLMKTLNQASEFGYGIVDEGTKITTELTGTSGMFQTTTAYDAAMSEFKIFGINPDEKRFSGILHTHPTPDNPMSDGDMRSLMADIRNGRSVGYFKIIYTKEYTYVLEISDLAKATVFAVKDSNDDHVWEIPFNTKMNDLTTGDTLQARAINALSSEIFKNKGITIYISCFVQHSLDRLEFQILNH